MAKDGFLDLGKSSKRIEAEDRKYYPTLPIESDLMKGMTIGQEGSAEIKYQVDGRSIEVKAIKFLGGKSQQKEEGNNGGK